MYNPYFLKQWALHRYKDGPLCSHLVGYAIFLKDKGYTYSSGQRYVREVAHLSVWMKKHKIAIEKVDENLIRQYIPYRKGASIRIKISPYWLLLKYLREENIIRVAPVLKCTPAQKIISDFENFLLNERGLTNETIRHYLRFTREFIHEYSSKNGLRFDHISVEDLTNHIIHNSQACARSYAMRQFIRFLFLRGLIACDISMAIPHIPHWRQCHLPSFLEPHETRACLNASEVETPIGSRDLAIKLLLVQLGLRAIEICRLKLSDIDWENSRITITGKGGGKHLLPLPYEAGKSLVNYLRHGRPKCADRHVFIRSIAPYRGFLNATTIGSIVRKSLQKAGVKKTQSGPHLLRHTFATQMLRKGATLSEIGEILHHQSVDTTMIYAKVALDNLALLVVPWPGEVL